MFDVQRELSDRVVIAAAYQGNAGHKLERYRVYDQAVHRTGPRDSTPFQQRQPWPEFNLITQVDGAVNSTYNTLTVKMESRYRKGLNFLVGYTWAKAIDSGSTIGADFGDRFPGNHYDLSGEKGLSHFHIGRRLTASFLYDLPFGKGKRFLSGGGLAGHVLGDWRMGSILTFAEGGPASVRHIGDRNSTGLPTFPDATGISPNLDNPTPDRLWNVEAFDTNNPELRVREGNVGRSVLRLPGLANWDFSLLKDVTLHEGHRLQIRFEAFNFSNHPNWIAPFIDVRSPVFGGIPVAREMRQIQFGIKYIF